jgi:hypothetical protein
MVASVKVVDSASGSQIKQVEAAMRIVGLDIEGVRARHPTQDQPHVGEALPWIISITLAAPVAAFFAAIGSEAGKDAYLALKEWLRGIAAISHPAVYGHVEIEDPEGTKFDLRPKALPDEAFTGLLELDWSKLSGGELVWAEEEKRWMEYHDFIEHVARPKVEEFLGHPLEEPLG